MSRQAIKALDALLEGAERIARPDAIKILEYLGFKYRRTNGAHNTWYHPDCDAKVTWSQRKKNDPVWGYEIGDLRKAVNTVLEQSKERNKPMAAQPTVEKITLPKNYDKMRAMLEQQVQAPAAAKPAKTINITSANFPADVAELVLEYETKKITGRELCDTLNSYGYRTATGLEFIPNSVSGLLVQNSGYKKWKESREAMAAAQPNPKLEIAPPVNPPNKLDPASILAAFQDLIAENERLTKENAELRQWQSDVRKAVCGG